MVDPWPNSATLYGACFFTTLLHLLWLTYNFYFYFRTKTKRQNANKNKLFCIYRLHFQYWLQVKSGLVFATATEDMDALTFGSNILLRHLTMSEARKMPIQEIHLDKVLEGLKLTHDEVGNENRLEEVGYNGSLFSYFFLIFMGD